MNSDDLIIWPDGTLCYRSELHEYSYMSDDYIVLSCDDDPLLHTAISEEL